MTFISNPTDALPAPSGGNWMLEVARRNFPGIIHVNKFGSNKDIGTATTPEDLWNGGGKWVPPTAARVHDIVSTSVNDTSGATGARTVRVAGLDSSWNLLQEDVTMNGTTVVATTNAFWRIFRAKVLTAGGSESNEGIISITAQTDATLTAQIEIGDGQSLMAIYTVPAGKTAYMTRAYATLDRTQTSTASCQMILINRVGLGTGEQVIRTRHVVSFATDGTSARSWVYLPYKSFDEKTDIIWRITDVTANATQIHGGFDLILVDN